MIKDLTLSLVILSNTLIALFKLPGAFNCENKPIGRSMDNISVNRVFIEIQARVF